jgi:hypothetical protein
LILRDLVASGEWRVTLYVRPMFHSDPPPPGVLHKNMIRCELARHFLQRCDCKGDMKLSERRNACRSERGETERVGGGENGFVAPAGRWIPGRGSSREGAPGQTQRRIAQ